MSESPLNVCVWTEDRSPDDDGIWDTACGKRYFMPDAPMMSCMRICCYCGRKIEESRYE